MFMDNSVKAYLNEKNAQATGEERMLVCNTVYDKHGETGMSTTNVTDE